MCRMRAAEENIIMPDSGDGSRHCCIAPVPLRMVSADSVRSFWGGFPWCCRADRGIQFLLAKCSPGCARVAPRVEMQVGRLPYGYRPLHGTKRQFEHI